MFITQSLWAGETFPGIWDAADRRGLGFENREVTDETDIGDGFVCGAIIWRCGLYVPLCGDVGADGENAVLCERETPKDGKSFWGKADA